jgi:filamentous hemagglutinin family protein
MAVQKNRAALERRSSHRSAGLQMRRPSGRLRAWHGPFATATAIAAVLALPRYSLAGPTGGTVVGGSATISQSGSTTNINQSTNQAIINWQTFSIAPSETVNFNQPSSTSATLNRVIGNEQSIIAGALNANGRVFIINSAGIIFTKGAQVNVGGLVASTLDISNQDFMARNYKFSGTSSAAVINQGRIHANPGGYVALLGKTVSNDGVIVANLGTVAMVSGEKITLNFAGNSLVDVTIDQGTLNALVENKRAIIANGGRVILTAKAADQILSAQVNNSGIIQARTMASLKGGSNGTRVVHKGSIKLLAQGGTVNVTGKLDASAPKGGDGGSIETSGDKVKIADSAVITTKSTYGQNGSWLIDPDGFTIAPIGGDISGKLLSAELGLSNITIASTSGHGTDGNINVNDTVTWSSGTTLTLNATNAINVNALISGPNGGLTLNAGTDITINAPLQVATLNATAVTGDISINATQTFPMVATGTWTFSAGADIKINAPVNVPVGTLTLNVGFSKGEGGVNPGFVYLNDPVTIGTPTSSANLVITYDPNMDTSMTTVQGFPTPSATYGTPLGGINPFFDPNTGTFKGSIQFADISFINSLPTTNVTTSPLTINGKPYVLITSIGDSTNPHDLTKINGSSGNFALADSLDAGGRLDSNGNVVSGSTVYNAAPVTTFNGNLEGLGNTVSNLVIVPATVKIGVVNFGLIGTLGGTGTVRDIGSVNVYIRDITTIVSGAGTSIRGGIDIGGLVGTNNGTIINAYATGNPNASVPPGSPFNNTTVDGISNPSEPAALAGQNGVGGLVGENHGIIVNSHAAVSVYGSTGIGGLVGSADIVLANSPTPFPAPIMLNDYSTGTVTAGVATPGTVLLIGTGGVGGFIGTNNGGVISNSYTTSDVLTWNETNGVGGFAGQNNPGVIISGLPIHVGTLNNDSSSGQVTFNFAAAASIPAVGGLVGDNSGQINNSFTSSNIVVNTPSVGGFPQVVAIGGLVGNQSASGPVVGTTSNSTSVSVITCNNCNSSNFIGAVGTNFGGPTPGSNWNPGGPATPPPGQGPQLPPPQNPAQDRSQGQALANQAAALAAAVAQAQAGGNAATAAATGTLRAATSSPPSSSMSAAGTAAATVPSGAAINGNLRTIETSVQADDQRIRRRVIAAAAAAPPRRTNNGGDITIRNIEINGKRMDVPEQAPKNGAPQQNPQ